MFHRTFFYKPAILHSYVSLYLRVIFTLFKEHVKIKQTPSCLGGKKTSQFLLLWMSAFFLDLSFSNRYAHIGSSIDTGASAKKEKVPNFRDANGSSKKVGDVIVSLMNSHQR
jgi:hypothetical protein